TGASSALAVSLSPTAAGARSAAVTITDNATGSPHSAALSGAGNTAPQVSLNPASLTFPGQNVGSTSTAQTVTLNNTGSAALSISSIAITGANAADFAQSNNCAATLAPGANCTLSVTFTPTAAGARSAAVTITDNA